jgi:hypothetical protein
MIKKLLLLLIVVVGLFLVGCAKDEPTVDVDVVDGYVITVLDGTKPVKEYYVVVKLNKDDDVLYDVKVKPKYPLLDINHNWNFPKGSIINVKTKELLPHREIDNS